MATLLELRNAVTSLIGLPGVPLILQLNRNTRERAFEAYFFGLLVRAIRQVGGAASATITGIQSGPNPNLVVLRGGPGRLGSRAQDFAYADCVLDNKRFEVHVDVQYAGGSGAIHEVDLSIYDHKTAHSIRQSLGAPNTFPASSKLIGAIECKFYDKDLGTHLGRTFVGLLDDCGILRFKVFVTNGNHSGLAKYFAVDRRPMRFFDLSPTNVQMESDCVSWLVSELKKWAGLS